MSDPTVTGAELIDLGVYKIRDGWFDLTLDEAGGNYWAIADGLRFVPTSLLTQAPSADELLEREEQMRALGYAD